MSGLQRGIITILPVVSLAWIVFTAITGLPSLCVRFNIRPDLHVWWTSVTGVLIIFVEFIWIRLTSKHAPSKKLREIVSQSYFLILWVFLAYAVGVGAQMRFFPLSLHQIVVWPLAAFFLWVSLKQLIHSIKSRL